VTTIRFQPGTPIEKAARELVAAAAAHGSAKGAFNDIELTATADTTVDAVVDDFSRKNYERHLAWRKSPEGIEHQRQRDLKIAAMQERHDALMNTLRTLDFNNPVAILDWLCEMQEPSDLSGVAVRREAIIATFENSGYFAGVNCDSEFRKGDRDNELRWLIGQALVTLQHCSIHPMIHRFVAEWKTSHVSVRR
jgi:hypothetical protein